MECSREKSQVYIYMLVHDTVGDVKLSTKRQSSKSTEVLIYPALKGMMFKRLDCKCNDKSIALQSIDDPVKFLYTTSDHLALISNEYLEILQAVPSWIRRFEVFKTEGLLEKATIAKPSNKVQVETAKGNCIGTLKYKGRLHKKPGTYFGVEVDKPIGDSNGTYDRISHFSCKKDHGMFISIDKIIDFPGVSLPQPLKSGKAKVRKSTQEPNIQEQFHHLQIGARVTAFIEKGSKNIAKPVKGTLRYIGKPNKDDEVIAGIELDENCKKIGESFQTSYRGKKLFYCSNNERYFLTKPETLFPEDEFKPEDGDIYEPYEILTHKEGDGNMNLFNSKKSEDILSKFSSSTSEDLLQYFLQNDKEVILKGEVFEIPLKLSLINRFIPVMSKALSTMVGNSVYTCVLDSQQVISITEFDENITRKFVSILTNYTDFMDPEIKALSWSELLSLIKFAHFYSCDIVLALLFDIGEMQINKDNIYVAISIMGLLGSDKWHEKCKQILSIHKRTILNNPEWEKVMKCYPTAVARLLTELLKS